MAISTKRKKYKTAEITEISRYFKEVAEAFEEDQKQILAHYQALYIAEKQKQMFDEMIVEKRKKLIERQKRTQENSNSGSELAQ
ncbi:hypothetical protein P7H71_09455 [Lactococcus lactis]|uniref:hypothetical protein n=1 Tax=Lactococcus lactis TaxID=1358 RepID=UPI00288D0165|nr:hypothetical protein [Lactococcus lactis]MDT2884575.1 hypothetical protein [Lactococcus lactis]MDT2900754.1 hypothetical protein [Lactococcus lactis]MDT2922285.1 hypothetical protein [Lactococcus lactis]MDT2941243.1 hypothetical protein [Lactococcus lactis]MDT2971333.1 hypothetical protein [Lactococcus lactis]